RRPGVGRERPQRQADTPATLRIGLELHDLRLDPLAHMQDVGGVRHAPVADLAHVDESLDPAEIHERTEVADRRHRAGADGALAPLSQCRATLPRGLLPDQLAGRHDRVPPPRLELRDAEAQALAGVVRACHAAAVDLRAGTEGAYAADLHLIASLDLARDHAVHRNSVHERLLELAGHVAPAAGDALQHDRARARAVLDDRRLDLVALLQTH